MQITDHVHVLKIPFQITDPSGQKVPRFVYAFLIYGERIWLIDSGVAGSERIILDYLKKTGRSPEEISNLVLTHAHPDHIGASASIKRISGYTVAAQGGGKKSSAVESGQNAAMPASFSGTGSAPSHGQSTRGRIFSSQLEGRSARSA